MIGSTPLTLTATYAATGPAPGTYRLRAEHSQKCVEYRPATYFLFSRPRPNASRSTRAAARRRSSFALTNNGDGSYRLGLEQQQPRAGRQLRHPPRTRPSCRWPTPAPLRSAGCPRASGTRYTLQNAGSGKCLEVQSASTADGTTYVQTTCANRASQRFEIVCAVRAG